MNTIEIKTIKKKLSYFVLATKVFNKSLKDTSEPDYALAVEWFLNWLEKLEKG